MCKTQNCSEVSPNPNPKSNPVFSAISHVIPPPLGNGPVPSLTLPILSSPLARERQREPSCLQWTRASFPVQNEISPSPYFSPALSCPSPSLPFSLTVLVWDLDSASSKGSLLHKVFSVNSEDAFLICSGTSVSFVNWLYLRGLKMQEELEKLGNLRLS